MKPKVYIDGQAGTTGLQIISRLENRDDIELLKLDDDKRHDDAARAQIMKEADLVFLCLPDKAAIEAVKLCDPTTKIIDASTAHRIDPDWAYGFAELDKEHEQAIQNSRLVANPGCHATGMISLIYPLIKSGILNPESFLSVFSLTGYSGGGKAMIAEYEEPARDILLSSPQAYGLTLNHKHIPEMMKVTGLKTKPGFLPVVDDYYKGMETNIVLTQDMLNIKTTPEEIRKLYQDWYRDSVLIEVADQPDAGRLPAGSKAGKDSLEIHVNGNEEQILLSAVFDNLGKGASGAAVQNMNLMLKLNPICGLNL